MNALLIITNLYPVKNNPYNFMGKSCSPNASSGFMLLTHTLLWQIRATPDQPHLIRIFFIRKSLLLTK